MPFVLEGQDKWVDQPVAAHAQCPFAPQSANSTTCPVTGQTTQVEAFQPIYPIMARLPEEESTETWEDKQLKFGTEYFDAEPNSNVPGTLGFDPAHKNVRYTQSRLPKLDQPGKDLWAGLHLLHPLTSNYAGNFQARSRSARRQSSHKSCPMSQASSSGLDLVRRVFNWSDIELPESTEAYYYGVIFRSKRADNSEEETPHLMAADKLSHEEAVAAGGLLMYWYGVPDPVTGSNLATCIWRTREEAREASKLPFHRLATKHAAKAYEDFELSRYKVVKRAGERGISIEDWDLPL